MEACRNPRHPLAKPAAIAAALAVCCCARADDPTAAIRLPEWVDPSTPVQAASYEAAPRPRERPQAYAAPRPVAPPALREARPLTTPEEHAVRQLEHAASEARTAHALTRLLVRYHDTREQADGDDTLVARCDRVGSWAYDARGRARAARGERDQAVADYRAALVLNDENAVARHALAVALAESGDLAGALEEFSRVLVDDPSATEARRNRAALHLERGAAEAAVADCDAALEPLSVDAPERAGLLRLRGAALHASGRLRESASDLNEAIRLAPQDAGAYAARGAVFAEGGFYEQAISDFATAVHLRPDHAEAYRSLAWALATCPERRLRDPATAVEAAWRARRLGDGDDFLTLDAAAAAHASAGELDEAVRLQQRALVAAGAEAPADAQDRLRLYQAGRPYVAK